MKKIPRNYLPISLRFADCNREAINLAAGYPETSEKLFLSFLTFSKIIFLEKANFKISQAVTIFTFVLNGNYSLVLKHLQSHNFILFLLSDCFQ